MIRVDSGVQSGHVTLSLGRMPVKAVIGQSCYGFGLAPPPKPTVPTGMSIRETEVMLAGLHARGIPALRHNLGPASTKRFRATLCLGPASRLLFRYDG